MSAAYQDQTEARIVQTIDRSKTQALTVANGNAGLAFTNVDQMMEFGKLMAISAIAIPKHLRNSPGACMAVVVQAFEWGMTPYAVANKSYSVNDRLAYEAQLVHAVILKRAPIKGRPKVSYSGEGDRRRCKVWAELRDEAGEVVEYESPEIGKINPKNSPLWKSDPDQQLWYFSVRAWCRRHFPDVILGVYANDEIIEDAEYTDITPPAATAPEVEESAPAAPAIGRKPRASRKASAPPAGVGEETVGTADATAASDTPPSTEIEDATFSEVPAQDDGPPPADHAGPETGEIRSADEVWADYTQSLQADQSEADIGATWDRFESEIKGFGPGFTAKCSDAYVRRRDAIRGETAEQRKARLQPAYDDGVASFYRGRKPSLGVPAAYKDDGDLEKTWLKGYEDGKTGKKPDPNALPAGAEANPNGHKTGDTPPSSSEPVDAQSAVDAAYEAGRQAQKNGISQRGIPGDYRDPARKEEADAWLDGWRDASREA